MKTDSDEIQPETLEGVKMGYVYVRSQIDPGIRDSLTKFGPLMAENSLLGQRCPGCHQEFKEGEYATLIAFGPGSDPEERAKAKSGRVYNAVAIPGHWECVLGDYV